MAEAWALEFVVTTPPVEVTPFASLLLLLLLLVPVVRTRLRMLDDGLDGWLEDDGADRFARGMTLPVFFHRTPQALHRVFGPVGPARHNGVSVVWQWTHCSGDWMRAVMCDANDDSMRCGAGA